MATTVDDAGGRTLRLAFADIANPGWTAGSIYYTNLFTALRSLEERVEIVVVVAPHQRAAGHETYRDLADAVLEIPSVRRPLPERALRGAKRAVGVHPPTPLESLLADAGIDAMFASWAEYGPSFPVPLLGWIHDFQHLHHPELYRPEELATADALFTAMAQHCTFVVVSSATARDDFARAFPTHASKARVLRFVARVPPEVFDDDPSSVCARYHLPERFVYLPNQFWAHKNHRLVAEALAALTQSHPEVTVVCTGNPSDGRAPLFFGELLAHISELGVRDRFLLLGWVPHADTYRLIRQSMAVLQPSRFEGWSTTVEETKSIGKSIVISDLPIHREQDPPRARWFDPADAAALAAQLVDVYDTGAPGPDADMEADARARLGARTHEYAETFLAIAREAVAQRGS